MEIVNCFSSQNKNEIVGLKESIDENEVVIRWVENKLFFGNEKQSKHVKHKYVFKSNGDEEMKSDQQLNKKTE